MGPTVRRRRAGRKDEPQNAQLAYSRFAAYLLAHPIMLLILFPLVLVLCVVGACALNKSRGRF